MATKNEPAQEKKLGLSLWLAWLISGLVLISAIAGGIWLMRTKPQAGRQKPAAIMPRVEISEVAITNIVVELEAMGQVLPAREVALQAEINARILEIHPQLIEGGFVRAGEVLMRLDAASFEAAVLRQQAALTTAQAYLRLEEGQQDVARTDLAAMRDVAEVPDIDHALALRGPQLEIARAAVASAEAALREAILQVERSVIRAPFDAVVVSADAEVGGRGAPGIIFAHLVASEIFWVQAAVPVNQLAWINLPDEPGGQGAAVRIMLSDGRWRRGHVIRRLPDVEKNARMARVMIAVADPLGLDKEKRAVALAPLLLNDYVKLYIQGSRLDGVYQIPRAALQQGDAIWLVAEENRLDIVAVEVIWGDFTSVLVRGSALPRVLRLITTPLATPVQGMQLRLKSELLPSQGAPKAGVSADA